MSLLSPRVDIAFKKIFGTEENKDLLIALINAIVSPADQVSSIQLLNPYNPKNYKSDKLSILDIKAKACTGQHYNIEIQMVNEGDYEKRALYYWCRLYAEQLKSGQNYNTLAKAIGIHILNFNSVPDSVNYHSVFGIREKNHNFQNFEDMEIHTIELNKFSSAKEKLPALLLKTKTALDRWAAFLTHHDLLETTPAFSDDTAVQKALDVLKIMSLGEEERMTYQDHLDWMRLQNSALQKVEKEAEEKGIKIGEERGEKKGREEGIEIGEKKSKVEMARRLLAMNHDTASIAQLTDLSEVEIESLIS